MADNDDTTGDYVLVRRSYFDNLLASIHDIDDLPPGVDDWAYRNHVILAARVLVYDAAVGSAGDRMLGPDNPVQPVPATDNDG